jgi:hypothetical protein
LRIFADICNYLTLFTLTATGSLSKSAFQKTLRQPLRLRAFAVAPQAQTKTPFSEENEVPVSMYFLV